jgi:hypothetical protein
MKWQACVPQTVVGTESIWVQVQNYVFLEVVGGLVNCA